MYLFITKIFYSMTVHSIPITERKFRSFASCMRLKKKFDLRPRTRLEKKRHKDIYEDCFCP